MSPANLKHAGDSLHKSAFPSSLYVLFCLLLLKPVAHCRQVTDSPCVCRPPGVLTAVFAFLALVAHWTMALWYR